MDNSKYEAVRAKIVEACELSTAEKCKSCDGRGTDFPFGSVLYNRRDICLECNGKRYIGHYEPARLSHVLRAIDPLPMSKRYTVMSGGTFVLIHSANAVTSTDITWDMAKDDLSLQSPETIDFLFKILCE